MALNGLGPKAVRRIAREAKINPDYILRAVVVSHSDHWVVWLTMKGHIHAAYDRRSGDLELFPPDPVGGVCTSLCRELFPDKEVTLRNV